ncbi:hypothetical protein AB1N83_008377 [Pleurotus pulmonarius]
MSNLCQCFSKKQKHQSSPTLLSLRGLTSPPTLIDQQTTAATAWSPKPSMISTELPQPSVSRTQLRINNIFCIIISLFVLCKHFPLAMSSTGSTFFSELHMILDCG